MSAIAAAMTRPAKCAVCFHSPLALSHLAIISLTMLHIIALLALSLLFGGMVFFVTVVAPLVFTKLPAKEAGKFIRAVFPVYYLYVLITSAVASAALVPLPSAIVMALVALLTIWLRQGLMPWINRCSDALHAGDQTAKRRFDLGHRVSVVINLVQMLAVAGVLVLLAI